MQSEIIERYFPDIYKKEREKFDALLPLYKEWNSKINVISRTDIENLYIHHILHSLAIVKFFEKRLEAHPTSILDVGTGGGFPGIPLAICYPNIEFHLIDSIGKKIKVVENIANTLELKNVTAVQTRVEEYDKKFDWIVSRAVTNLSNMIPWIKSKYCSGALFLKGGSVSEEISEAVRKFKITPNKFSVYQISDWFKEEYFSTKELVCLKP